MQRGPVSTGKSHEDNRRFAAAHKVGDLVFTAGMTARGPDGKLVGAGDVAAQARQCAANVIAALEAAGSNASQIVKLTVYVTDIATYQLQAGQSGHADRGRSRRRTRLSPPP